VRLRAGRLPNETIDKEATFGEGVADRVAGLAGSWTFVISFGLALTVCRTLDSTVGKKAWDPYPLILLTLLLSMLAAVQAPSS